MSEELKAAFETAAKKHFPEIDLKVSASGIYTNTLTREQFHAFSWGVEHALVTLAEAGGAKL